MTGIITGRKLLGSQGTATISISSATTSFKSEQNAWISFPSDCIEVRLLDIEKVLSVVSSSRNKLSSADLVQRAFRYKE